MSARQDIERAAAEHRASTNRFVNRIDAIGRAARERSARLRAQRSAAIPATTDPTPRQSLVAKATAEPEIEHEPPTSWLG